MGETADLTSLVQAFCPRCGRYVGLAETCVCGWKKGVETLRPESPLWQVDVPGPVLGRPAVAPAGEGALVITPWCRLDRDLAPEGGGLVAVGLVDGRVHWHWPPEGQGPPPADAVAAEGGLAVFGTGDGVIRALRLETLERVWEERLDGAMKGAPLVLPRAARLYAATLCGSLYELDLYEGRPRKVNLREAAGFVAGPFLCRGLLVCLDERGEVWGVDPEQGQVRWHLRDPGGPPGWAWLAAGRDRVFLLTEGGDLHALIPGRERPVWSVSLGGRPSGPPTAVEGNAGLVLAPLHDGRLVARHLADGSEAWSFRMGKRATGVAGFSGGLVFVGSHDGHVYALDASTGGEVWRYPVGGRVVGGVVVHGGAVLFGTMVLDAERRISGGKVVALPWHFGRWGWAATWAEGAGALDAAALFHALEGRTEEALRLWCQAGREDLVGRFCESLGEDREAARSYEQAGERWRAQDPLRAAHYFALASECYERVGEVVVSDKCLRLARRLGGLPDLRIEPVNVPEFRQGEPGNLSVRLVNDGVAEAAEIALTLGSPEGGLAEPVYYRFEGSLKPKERWLLTLQVVTTAERSRIVVEAEYKAVGAGPGSWRSRGEIPIKAVPSPKPLVEVKGDIGLLKVEWEGQPAGGPVVRADRDVAVVRAKVGSPSRREPEKRGEN